jgi:hypothetical protein
MRCSGQIVPTLAAAALLGGCTLDDEELSETATEPRQQRAAVGQLVWERSFSFPEGRSNRHFDISAPKPPAHTWDVRVEHPRGTDVRLSIETWYGTKLRVFESTADLPASSCRERGNRQVCLARFPALEAQRPGRWTVSAAKLSKPAAEVLVEVQFTPLDGR